MSTIEYEAIVHHCVKTGELWEDPEFPAVQSSVFYHQTPPFSFQWKRPHVSWLKIIIWKFLEIYSKYVIIQEVRFYIIIQFMMMYDVCQI